MTRARKAIAELQATVMLVVLSLAMAYIAYGGLTTMKAGAGGQPVFANAATQLGGSPEVTMLEADASVPVTVSSMSLDGLSSSGMQVLYLDAAGYHLGSSLCSAGATTFFSVLASKSGSLSVSSNGASWISGAWTSSASVSKGWHAVMITGATSCSVTLPGGSTVGSVGPSLSPIPVEGWPNATTSFVFYLPFDGRAHTILLTTAGGFDTIGL